MRRLTLMAAMVLGLVRGAAALDESKVVDLTYPFDERTIYWPTEKPFHLDRLFFGETEQGYFYASNKFCTPEHGGTHMDAPIHFAAGKRSVDQVPLSSLIGPVVVVDVAARAAADRDYLLSVADLQAWEEKHGRIPAGAIVLMNSGWGQFWGDRKRYLGTDVFGDVENLHFPGFAPEAAEWLVQQRQIEALGVDTASIDHGPSKDFRVHRIVNGADKPAFENVANVDRLPASGATVIALPMKIGGGSGAPLRIIAVLP
jgi:kynurenine formamidase